MSTSFTMRVSRNGQVSIPAEARNRWRADEGNVADQVVVIDIGDYVIVAPTLVDPIRQLRGKYARRGLTSDEMRRQDRREATAHEAKRGGQRKGRPAGRRSA
ncbi:MAG: AbrB/MazE/SpoVT family DNA-binding domain-containing protein [Jatrophihabitantaceae bacterium]